MPQKGQITRHEWQGNYFRKVCSNCKWERIKNLDSPAFYKSPEGVIFYSQPKCITLKKIEDESTIY